MKKVRILVVDDVADNRDVLCRRLNRRGFETDTAVDGADCLAKIEGGAYDLVLLDIHMPKMNGSEVLRRLRETYQKTELPVIMVTAETDSGEVVKSLTNGANDYVTKPLDFPVVLARVEMQLALKTEVASSRQTVVVSSTEGLQAGFVIDGRYEIEELIGEGGFAVVYRARQLTTDRQVAVKVLRLDRLVNVKTADVEIARFEQEMRLIGKIQHPHIVRLIDSGRIPRQSRSAGGGDDTVVGLARDEAAARSRNLALEEESIPYLVMDLLEGETLAEHRRKVHKLEATVAVDIVIPVAAAVAAAHAVGIVHRDLKPSNIVLSPAAGGFHPHVLDFGIAKLTGEGIDELTKTASVIGTPDYMAPEQARGRRDVSGAADQYTLAVVLYECLTGRKPYDADSFVELLHVVSAGDFLPPSRHDPSIDQRLEAIILRAMRLTPQERFPSMLGFARALVDFASEENRPRLAALV